MYLIRELTDLSYEDIGRYFGDKHHSAVMYSVDKIRHMIETDTAFAKTIDIIAKSLR
jgi:chromosomal replication initiator protein